MDRERRETLLKEYEVCEQDNKAHSSTYWTIFGIYISINAAILGGLAYGLFSTDIIHQIFEMDNQTYREISFTFSIVAICVAVMEAITILLKFWLGRVNYLISCNHGRIHYIEIELKIWRSLRIYLVDKWNDIRRSLKIPYSTEYSEESYRKIWSNLWQELREEFPLYEFRKMCLKKNKIADIIKYQPKDYYLPSRNIAYLILWIIISFYIFAFAFSVSTAFYHGLSFYSILIGISAATIITLLYIKLLDIKIKKGDS